MKKLASKYSESYYCPEVLRNNFQLDEEFYTNSQGVAVINNPSTLDFQNLNRNNTRDPSLMKSFDLNTSQQQHALFNQGKLNQPLNQPLTQPHQIPITTWPRNPEL
jgi:hypothetical protein